MGMFDEISVKIKCNNCGINFVAEEQVKWTYNPFLHKYEIGDSIDAEDGEYEYGSWLRDKLYDVCPKCGFNNIFSVTVKNGKLKKVTVIKAEMFTKYSVQDKS